jgi:hypothetical protein
VESLRAIKDRGKTVDQRKVERIMMAKIVGSGEVVEE